MEFVQCSPEGEEEEEGGGGERVGEGLIMPRVCRGSVRKKEAGKWGHLAAPLPLTPVRERDQRGSAEGQSAMFRWLNVFDVTKSNLNSGSEDSLALKWTDPGQTHVNRHQAKR